MGRDGCAEAYDEVSGHKGPSLPAITRRGKTEIIDTFCSNLRRVLIIGKLLHNRPLAFDQF